ncbi:HNH endonuclease [Corynebacterium sp.]|uniref:HNH endonuclease n=1 Tax=Corynebacterium sp. TaxID=1720 RepID=UPI0026DC56EA|nr:HNH endonuclease signature motif containing protein [Corynebacterium sp.]MDO5076630.1 HNH endonuclease signature motif containing protein [Corynebacterium sp.]
METITREELVALMGPKGEFYGLNNPDGDPLTMAYHRGILRKHLEHHIDPLGEDVGTHCSKYAVIYNTSAHVQRNWLYCIETLLRLPHLTKHALNLGHLDYSRLRAIESATKFVPLDNADAWHSIDVFLVRALTASRANQAVPNASKIKAITTEFVKKLQLAGEVDQELTPSSSVLIFPSYIPGYSHLNIEAPTEVVEAVAQAVDALATKHDLTHAEAFALPFLKDEVLEFPKSWTVHFFGTGPQPVDFQPDYVEDIGILTAAQQELFKQNYTYFDLEKLTQIRLTCYTPPRELKEAVRLRDGHCRYPGCNVRATECQIDHVIRYQDGGWTTYVNLQCLCKKHHNYKTDQRVSCTMANDGTVTWVIAGETIVTPPEGRIAGIIGNPLGNLTLRPGFTFPVPLRLAKRGGLGDWGTNLNSLLEKRRTPKPPPKPIEPIPAEPPPDEGDPPF